MRQLILLAGALFLVGCLADEPEISPTQFDREFFRLPTDEQVKTFQAYDVERQYELVIVGNQILHPPAIYLVQKFANRGAPVVPFLRGKLEIAKKEATVRDIVAILVELDHLNLYEVRKDARLMALVEERTAAMQGQWRPVTQSMVAEIRDHPPQ